MRNKSGIPKDVSTEYRDLREERTRCNGIVYCAWKGILRGEAIINCYIARKRQFTYSFRLKNKPKSLAPDLRAKRCKKYLSNLLATSGLR